MTVTIKLPVSVRPSRLAASLTALGRSLRGRGERYAADDPSVTAYLCHEERLRDGLALRHSGIWF